MSRHARANLKEVTAAISALAVLSALALSWPTDALAQRCVAPPGTSAIEQYCETVPGPGGDRGTAAPQARGRELPPGVVSQLKRAGQDGAALLEATGASGDPVGAGGSARESSRPDKQDDAPAPGATSDGGSPLSALEAAADSGPSTGALFLWVLAGLAALLTAGAWIRSRVQRD